MTPAPWRIDVLDRFEQRLTDATSTILELGCGTGQLAAHLATHGWDVVAIDLSPGNVEATASRGIDAHVADFADLPFADGAFDAAFAFNSLLHVPKPELPWNRRCLLRWTPGHLDHRLGRDVSRARGPSGRLARPFGGQPSWPRSWCCCWVVVGLR